MTRQHKKSDKAIEDSSDKLERSIVNDQKIFSEHPGLLQKIFESINPQHEPLYLLRGLKKEDLDVLYVQAYKLYQESQFQEALHFFWMMALYNHQDKRAWMGIGTSAQQSKQYEIALKAYTAISQLDAKDPYPYFHSFECYIELHQPSEALEQLEKALNLSKKDSKHALLHQKIKEHHKTLLAQKKQPRKNK